MKKTKPPLRAPARASGPEPDLRRATNHVLELLAIPGRSGEEQGVAACLSDHLRRAGVPAGGLVDDGAHRRSPFGGQIGNLILKLRGTVRAPRRLFTAHMDTVPICVGCRPVRKGRIVRSASPQTGLGADDRAGCAVLLNTVLEILQHRLPHPPLTFCWMVQEEVGLKGSQHLRAALLGNPRLGFNFDGGSAAKITVGATGGYRMTIEIHGVASHAGGAPEHGVSAIAVAALAIADLHREGWHGDVRKSGRQGTSNVGVIAGGEATNVVTDHVTVRAEARSHDPAFRQQIIARIEQAFHDAAREVTNVDGACGRVEILGRLDYESFLLAPDEPCVRLAEEAIRSVGRLPERAVTNGGLDANWLVRFGIPTASLGCGQCDQHMKSETLNLDEFVDACRIALRLATDVTPFGE